MQDFLCATFKVMEFLGKIGKTEEFSPLFNRCIRNVLMVLDPKLKNLCYSGIFDEKLSNLTKNIYFILSFVQENFKNRNFEEFYTVKQRNFEK